MTANFDHLGLVTLLFIFLRTSLLDAAARSRCFGEINKKYSLILVLPIHRASKYRMVMQGINSY